MLFDILSIIFGLAGWMVAIIGIVRGAKVLLYKINIPSLTLCALAVAMQVLELSYRASSGDIAGIIDTVDAVGIISLLLILITLILNMIALKRSAAK